MPVTQQSASQPALHPAFKLLNTEKIDSLNIDLEIYEHTKTGAMHFHLAADNSENVFLVALRTVPTDSSGVAHILEHTALCGSERYPVRDPFFMMIRRSLNTFMNAFTSTDWTAYPFASQNRKDFNNLLDVYLDAVFFSRLHELDFAQEGHRLAFDKADDINSDLVYKGVVFNEMKGAMSSVASTVWHTMSKYLFPSNTYHFNSGGEPSDIPDLTYEQLKLFYKTHYHPSNSIFMTYGDISAYEHQQKFDSLVLSRFEKLDKKIKVDDIKRFYAPINIQEAYALDEEHDEQSPKDKSHLVMGWLLGSTIDLEKKLKAQLLSDLLLSSSASPLLNALETTDIGSSPSGLCGLEDSNKEMSFMCGLEGSNNDKTEDFEKLVLEVLEDVAKNGVDQKLLDAVLHQLELGQREISGEHYPYGLQLILSGISTAIHRGDVASAMNVDKVLDKISEEIKQKDFVQNLVKELLLDNQHRVCLSMQPDTGLSARKDAAEKIHLAAIKKALTDAEKQNIVELSKKLDERQQQIDDESILPKVGIEDIPENITQPDVILDQTSDIGISQYAQGTNGIAYQQLVIDLPELSSELLETLPIFCHCLTELGCDNKSYIETQLWQSSVSGGIGAYTSFRGSIDDEQKVRAVFVLSSKALKRNFKEMSHLLKQTMLTIRFDEIDKIKEIISQLKARKEQSITGSGHQLAMLAASSQMSPSAQLSHQNQGLLSVQSIKKLDKSMSNEADVEKLIQQFKQIHQLLLAAPKQFVLVAENDQLQQFAKDISELWSNDLAHSKIKTKTSSKQSILKPVRKQVKQAWFTSTQVNFCAKSYPTVTIEHKHAPALSVLGSFLRNGLLHRLIREQGGAYGGGAMHDSGNACFKFFSYRDPRLKETLDDFDAAIDWLKTNEHTEQSLEEAILSVVSSLDKPSSPSGEAKGAFHNDYFGRTLKQRQAFRKKVITVKIEELVQLADIYFKPENASIAVICNSKESSICEDLGLEAHTL